jgi:hypothetical protein
MMMQRKRKSQGQILYSLLEEEERWELGQYKKFIFSSAAH